MEIPEGFSELPTKALGVIRAAKLAHPRGVLLESFITEAADRDRAAKHLLAQIAPQDNSHDVAAYLDAFCADWSKLVANCEMLSFCIITAVTAQHGAPLSSLAQLTRQFSSSQFCTVVQVNRCATSALCPLSRDATVGFAGSRVWATRGGIALLSILSCPPLGPAR